VIKAVGLDKQRQGDVIESGREERIDGENKSEYSSLFLWRRS